MAYCTLQQLIDRYGERRIVDLTDRGEYAQGAIDTATVDRAIADAGATIDGYLAARYALPLSAPQPLIEQIALVLTWWNLHTADATPKAEADYKAAVRQLEQIAAGTIRLTANGVDAEGTGASGVEITDRERPFTEDNMKGFI